MLRRTGPILHFDAHTAASPAHSRPRALSLRLSIDRLVETATAVQRRVTFADVAVEAGASGVCHSQFRRLEGLAAARAPQLSEEDRKAIVRLSCRVALELQVFLDLTEVSASALELGA